jgi:hypothetical protein
MRSPNIYSPRFWTSYFIFFAILGVMAAPTYHLAMGGELFHRWPTFVAAGLVTGFLFIPEVLLQGLGFCEQRKSHPISQNIS